MTDANSKSTSFTDLNTWKEGHKLVLKIYETTEHFPPKAIAQGSLTELQNQLLIARDIGYIKEEGFQETAKQTVTVNKLINGLKRIRECVAAGALTETQADLIMGKNAESVFTIQ